MTVLSRVGRDALEEQLQQRFRALLAVIEPRDLMNDAEGCSGKNHWTQPQQMCAIKASQMDLQLAVDDFKNVLAHVRKLK